MREFVEVKKALFSGLYVILFFIFTLLFFQPDTFREDNRNDDIIENNSVNNCFNDAH